MRRGRRPASVWPVTMTARRFESELQPAAPAATLWRQHDAAAARVAGYGRLVAAAAIGV